jgi:hypothetical protein
MATGTDIPARDARIHEDTVVPAGAPVERADPEG